MTRNEVIMLDGIMTSFHFIRPWALVMVPLVIAVSYIWMRVKMANSRWQHILPAHLHSVLIASKGNKQSKQAYIWLMIALTLGCFALAGPAWQKLPQPVYQTDSGRVLVMDMSLSMRATDVSPSRLARAKFKAIDLIQEVNDGEVGLVAYASDAFTISPLTQDISNLENLIPALSPEIMPSDGSNPIAGLQQAQALLEGAGYQYGHIYWITDGIENIDVKPIRDFINDSPFEFSALLIGSEEGAPIRLSDGSLLKDNRGAIVIPQLDAAQLRQALSPSNARFTRMSINASDIESMLLTSNRLEQVRQEQTQESTGDAYEDAGIYLVLLLLPICALLFRKGLLFSLCLSVFLFTMPPHNSALAQETDTSVGQSANTKGPQESAGSALGRAFRDAFLNQDQRAKRAYESAEFDKAQSLFRDTNWRAAAAYKAGDYESALSLYQQSDGLDSIYNQGNALAKLGQFQKAIDAYNKVLNVNPDHEDAARNKAIVEDLLEQQQQQENQQQDGQNQDQESQDQSSEEQQSQDQQNSGESQDGEQSQLEQEQEQNQQSESESDAQQNDDSQTGQNEQADQQQSNAERSPDDEEAGEQEQDQEQQESQSSGEQNAQAEEQEQDAETGSVQAIRESDLTPEEREQMQRMQMLMNKVPDDPAFLLQRKMMIEAQRRKQYGPPQTQEQEW
ncbi:vWA domain-containing protein [Ningiella sp. W23]|uniref:vWA domain-containing protein n=1 Tax=Ningiella sp. W23 TaxID=3023715 RepID=UPI0037573198